MKKIPCLLIFAAALSLLAMVSCKEETLNLTPPDSASWKAQTRAEIDGLNGNTMKVLSSSESALVMELNVGNYAKKAVSIEGNEYFAISAPEAHSMLKAGMPDLPEYAYSVVIPPTSACNVRVVNAEYEDISLPVAPSKGRRTGRVDSETVPYIFSDVYEKDAFYPAKLATTDAPFLMRDVRGSVVRVHPFQYNPVTGILRVYKKMEIEVSFSGTDTRNVLTSDVRHSNDNSFEGIFKDQFVNYDVMASSSPKNILSTNTGKDNGGKGAPPGPDDPNPPMPIPTEEMLIICCDSFAIYMNGFTSHKNNNMGITTRVVTMSQLGSTAENVANYIQYDYNNNGNLAYVLLVGDATRVPTKLCPDNYIPDYYGGADPLYALVSGTDSIPDILVGRFSARNSYDVLTMVNKTIYYENNISTNQPWHHISIGISDGGTCYNHPIYNYEYMDSIMDMLLYSEYSTEDNIRMYACSAPTATFSYPSEFIVRSTINEGAYIINYIGEGYINEWYIGSDSHFNSTSIESLANVNKLPFVYSGAKNTGAFICTDNNPPFPCLAETWLTARYVESSKYVGAIGCYAPSILSPDIEYVTAIIAFNQKMINGNANTFGALCYGSAVSMRNQYGNASNCVLLTMNYFGDPSVEAKLYPIWEF